MLLSVTYRKFLSFTLSYQHIIHKRCIKGLWKHILLKALVESKFNSSPIHWFTFNCLPEKRSTSWLQKKNKGKTTHNYNSTTKIKKNILIKIFFLLPGMYHNDRCNFMPLYSNLVSKYPLETKIDQNQKPYHLQQKEIKEKQKQKTA